MKIKKTAVKKKINSSTTGFPVVKADNEKELDLVTSEAEIIEKIMELTHTSNPEVGAQIIHAAAIGQTTGDMKTDLARAWAQFVDLEPKTPLEALLVAQMLAVNNAISLAMKRFVSDGSFQGPEALANIATKLQRTFLAQVETLQKLRGKGQQKVIVEHVHVHQGGQAVVGTVEHHTTQGEGNEKN